MWIQKLSRSSIIRALKILRRPNIGEIFGKMTEKPKVKRSVSCCVPDCPTGLVSHPEERSPTFPFPIDLEVRNLWLKRINREFPNGISNHRVCERHFLPDDLLRDEDNLTQRGKKRAFRQLKPQAIPSQNLSCEIKVKDNYL